MTVDDAARAEAEIARAAIVLVTSEIADTDPTWLARLPPDRLGTMLASTPPAVQPGQLWLLDPELRDEVASCRQAIESLGAFVEERTHGLEAWMAIARHLADEAALHRDCQVELRRQNTALRRELNRALSALDHRHPMLGLLPSASLDDLEANRQPRVPPRPAHSRPLMLVLTDVPGDLRSAQEEILELREELAAIDRTKVMRWTRVLRRLYARVRRV